MNNMLIDAVIGFLILVVIIEFIAIAEGIRGISSSNAVIADTVLRLLRHLEQNNGKIP